MELLSCLAFTFGSRTDDMLYELIALLKKFNIDAVYTDNNFAYNRLIPPKVHFIGKINTQHDAKDSH